jgi:CubicO group peptidase (beta-lactamase class C family)
LSRKVLLIVLSIAVFFAGVEYIILDHNDLLLPEYRDDVDQFMESRRLVMDVPGLAAGVITSDGLEWGGYYGTYDGENPVSEDTVFMIASISKTVIGTAAMQLWEQGYFELDDDINDYLDFEVRNPSYPEVPITFRHLMTHFSSITDRYPVYIDLYTIEEGGGDSPWGLGEFLQEYLAPDGQFYDAGNYNDFAPGSEFDYSNYGAALLAHLVEVLSGEEYSSYCRKHIFNPLDMDNTYYLLANIPASETELAVPFENGEALPHYSYPDYPAGALRTTIGDISKFAAFYLDPSSGALLEPATIELMFGEYGESEDFGEGQMGLIWVHMDWMLFKAVGHTGGDPGVDTTLLLFPEDDYGIVLFMNDYASNLIQYRQVMSRLRDIGRE